MHKLSLWQKYYPIFQGIIPGHKFFGMFFNQENVEIGSVLCMRQYWNFEDIVTKFLEEGMVQKSSATREKNIIGITILPKCLK